MKTHRFRFFRWRPRRARKLRGTSVLFKRFSSFEGLELRALLSGGSLLSDSGLYSSGLNGTDVHASPVNLLSISSLMASNLAQQTNDTSSASTSNTSNAPSDSSAPPIVPLAATESTPANETPPVADPLIQGVFGDVSVVFEDLDGNVINEVQAGQQFVMKLYVTDTRTDVQLNGFFSAYAGVTFDSSVVTVPDPNSLVVDDFFATGLPNFVRKDASTAGLVRAGGTTTNSNPTFQPGDPQLLWSVTLQATGASASPVTFTPVFEDFSDQGSVQEWLLYDLETSDTLTADNFDFQPAELSIVSQPMISIDDVSHVEGDTDQTYLFTVNLSSASSDPVTVAYQTNDGSALAGSDYTAASGTLTFNGTTQQIITVTVKGDLVSEPDEEFTVTLSDPTNALLGTATGTGTIINDDISLLGISDVTQPEGNTANTMVFAVTLTKPSANPVTVEFTTQDGTATTAGEDYTATSGTLTFQANSNVTQFITVMINGDTIVEPDETFQVLLSNPSNASFDSSGGMATGTLIDDDQPKLSFSPATVSQLEGDTNSNMIFTVTLSQAFDSLVTVAYQTVDGTALAGSDYTATSGTLTFAVGSADPQLITVQILGDTIGEFDESFTVKLTSPVNAGITADTATGTIQNDDAPTLTVTGPADKHEDANGGHYLLTATLSAPSDQPVTVVWSTADGSATTLNGDYTATSGTLSFAAGVTTQTFTVAVTPDTNPESDEQFKIELSDPVNVALPQTEFLEDILNDDLPTLSISAPASQNEGNTGNTAWVFSVTLSTPVEGPVTVAYHTVDGTATAADNDYVPTSGTITFDSLTSSQTITVLVVGDTRQETNETFSVVLSAPVGATLERHRHGHGHDRRRRRSADRFDWRLQPRRGGLGHDAVPVHRPAVQSQHQRRDRRLPDAERQRHRRQRLHGHQRHAHVRRRRNVQGRHGQRHRRSAQGVERNFQRLVVQSDQRQPGRRIRTRYDPGRIDRQRPEYPLQHLGPRLCRWQRQRRDQCLRSHAQRRASHAHRGCQPADHDRGRRIVFVLESKPRHVHGHVRDTEPI